MADQVGLGAVLKRRVGALSLGMKMRLSIGVALLGSPDLVLLDEPMNGLDPNGITWVRGVVASLRRADATVIVSSHLLGELETMIDDAVFVSKGEIVRVERMSASKAVACELEVDHPAVLVAAASERGVPATLHRSAVRLGTTTAEAVRIATAIGVDVLSAAPVARSLESLYEEITSAEFEAEGVQ